jgi:hypothetical protein
MALIAVGVVFGILPGCVEVFVLNWATPFLLNQ